MLAHTMSTSHYTSAPARVRAHKRPSRQPSHGWTGSGQQRLDMSGMAATLRRLASYGARDFYEGEIGEGRTLPKAT